MRRWSCAVGALVALAPAAASAADNFISGVYLKSQEMCADAKKNSLQPGSRCRS